MIQKYSFGERGAANSSRVAGIRAVTFLTTILIITVVLIEFLYKFNPNNISQFIVVCVFSGFLSCWLLIEAFVLTKHSASKMLLWLVILQLIYGFSRELFLVMNYQVDVLHQNQHALVRLDFRAFPFIFIYCIIFLFQLGQILKLFIENERAANQEFLRILNSQPISIICFSRVGHQTVFINNFFKENFGFNEKDIDSVEEWLKFFKRNAYPCLDYQNGFEDFQTEIHTINSETRIVRVSREVTDSFIIDVLLDITEEEQKSLLIRQNQKELLGRSLSDKEFALDRANKMSEEFSTENRILMTSLMKANKTLSSGALSASIAHELTQPLTAMNLNLELMILKLQKKSFDQEVAITLARKIIQDNTRIGSIIHSLRSIFMDSHDIIELNDVSEMLKSVLDLVRSECEKRGIALELDIPKELKASFRPDEVRQVLLNVLGNAINILENIQNSPRIIKITCASQSGFVDIMISDSGPGVSSDIEPTLFELLRTTKKDGMGLGLWLSKYILTKSGGDIKYQRLKGWGATFQIRLPLAYKPISPNGGG